MLAQSEICSSWWTKYFKTAELGNNFWKGFWMSSKNKRLATKKRRRQVSWVWKCSQSCRTTNHKHVLSKPEINHSMLSSSWRSHCCNWFLRFPPPQIIERSPPLLYTVLYFSYTFCETLQWKIIALLYTTNGKPQQHPILRWMSLLHCGSCLYHVVTYFIGWLEAPLLIFQ